LVDRIEKFIRFKKKKPQLYQFPNHFLWGAATSSYQVEGGITGCDWHEWEPGHIQNGDRAGRACNHFELYEKDFDLAKSLNHNAHRFSLEWSRIEPEEGKWDEGALEHYRKVLVSLRERGLEPMVTLHHFTNPSWLSKYGFWDSPEIVRLYARYVKKVAETLLPHARYWITLNEPILVVYMGYLEGLWPPGKKKWKDAIEALRNIFREPGRIGEMVQGDHGL